MSCVGWKIGNKDAWCGVSVGICTIMMLLLLLRLLPMLLLLLLLLLLLEMQAS